MITAIEFSFFCGFRSIGLSASSGVLDDRTQRIYNYDVTIEP